jgi:predicted nucleic acid-binding protein
MVVLDTGIVIEVQRGNEEVIERVNKLGQENIFVTPVVIAEFFRGARDKDELIKCRKLIKKFQVLALGENVAAKFIELYDEFALSHRPGIPDMLIAAAAIYYNARLYTLNRKDFAFIPTIDLM